MSDSQRTLAGAPTEQPEIAGSTVAECLDELDRLVSAGAIEVGSRNYALLAYLIDHRLKAGPDVPVKAYSIAVDVSASPIIL